MIRKATREDIPAIIEIVSLYVKNASLDERSGVDSDYDSVEILARLHMIDRSRCLFVSISPVTQELEGLIAGVVSPWPTNFNILNAQETLAYGMNIEALRETFDVWAQSMGANVSLISCFTVSKGERMRILSSKVASQEVS